MIWSGVSIPETVITAVLLITPGLASAVTAISAFPVLSEGLTVSHVLSLLAFHLVVDITLNVFMLLAAAANVNEWVETVRTEFDPSWFTTRI